MTKVRPEMLLKLSELAGKGMTPALVFDLRAIRSRLQALGALGKANGCLFLMSAKSFPDRRVYELVTKWLGGFEITNAHEYRCLPAHPSDKLIWLNDSGLGHPISSFVFGRRDRVIVSCADRSHIDAIEKAARSLDYALRLNAAAIVKRGSSRFGFLPRESLKAMARSTRHRFTGFHMHYASEKNRPEDFVLMAKGALRLAQQAGLELEFLNLGGGLATLSLERIGRLLKKLRQLVPAKTLLVFEPGRLISEHAGFAVGKVLSVTRSDATVSCVSDLSRICHLGWSRADLLLLQERGSGGKMRKVNYYGPTAYEGDHLASGYCKAVVNRGDPVVFSNVCGYSIGWNTAFNGIKPARIVFLE